MSRPALDPLDFFDLDADLSGEHQLVRDSVRRFVAAEILPVIGERFRTETFDTAIVGRMADQGLLGSSFEGYGCAGLDKLAYGLICRELERGDSALRSFASVQTSLVMGAIFACGTDEQKARYLPDLAAGRLIGCFGLTESHGGSDPSNLRTRAVRSGPSWRIDGAKQWITNGGIADVAVVWAATDAGVAAFLIDRGADGFSQRSITGKLSLRASDTGELFFDGVVVDDESQRLPAAEGLKSALRCLDDARFGICWGAIGAAQSCLAETLQHVGDREVFGASLAGKQLIQERLADATRRLAGAQLSARRLTDLKLAGRARPEHVSLTKWNNVRTALDIARSCRDILGAAGITTELATMRHMLNLESVVTYEGTESIHTLVVGRALTGHSAF